MTLITDLTAKGSVTGSEEFLVSNAGADYKVTAAQITLAVTNALAAYEISNDAAVSTLNSGKLSLAGGTMTGLLTLSGAPTSGLHPTTKTYVDTLLSAKADATGQSFDATTTGITATDTTETTALATTAFVGSKIEYDVLKKTVVNTATKSLVYADRGTILASRTTTGTCTLTLPDSSGLTSADRTEYYIVDSGNNAETYNIIINCAGSDTFLDGTTTMSITGDGASVLLAVSGTTWIPKDLDAEGSDTVAGTTRLATLAEALAMSNTTAVITPKTLGKVFDQEIYNASVISGATKTFVESDSGVWYVTRTATGTCALTLPDPSALTDFASRYVIEVWDVETAGTNAITINTTAGTIDGATSVTIDVDKAGMKFINDGNNYFTVNNIQRASTMLSPKPTTGIGYTTGAGGTVAQATNRTTGVTLNTVAGQITTDNTSLAAGAAATFTVTNSAIASADTIIVNIVTGETTNQTNVRVTGVTAGAFDITVENNHASTAETGSIRINFTVIKGTTS